MDTHLFNISLIKSVGEISDKKIKQIIGLGYELVSSEEEHASFKRTEDGCGLFIAENQITLVERDGCSKNLFSDPDKIYEIFSELLDTLLLKDEQKIQVALERSYPSVDVFEKANKLVSNEIMFEGAFTTGYRIAFDRGSFFGEVKLEPMFKDSQHYYIQVVINSSEEKEKNAIAPFLKEGFDFITKEIEPLAKSKLG